MESSFLLPAFFVIAFVYASGGFGGGSGYIALLVIAGLALPLVRSTALLCNLLVAGSSLVLLYRSGYLRLHRSIPLVLLSVPMAFAGGMIAIDRTPYLVLLAVLLIVSAALMWFRSSRTPTAGGLPPWTAVLTGGGIGLVSGLVGIGGGIFLAPVLYFTRWGTAKEIAGATTAFIAVNSLAGLAGQLTADTLTWQPEVLLLLAAVFAGGQLGMRLTIRRLSPLLLSRAVATLVLVAGIRLLVSAGGDEAMKEQKDAPVCIPAQQANFEPLKALISVRYSKNTPSL